MNFRKLTALVLSFSMVFISGCTNLKNEAKKPVDNIQGKITVWTDKKNIEGMNLSIGGFKKLHNKAVIQIVEVSDSDLNKKLSDSLNLHSGVPDIVVVEDENAQLFLKNFSAALEDTSGDIKKDNYLKYKIDNLTRDGKLLGIPLNSKPGVLIYRKDLFLSAGINTEYIKTWQDFITAGKGIISKDKVPILLLPLENEETYRIYLNQLGGSYFDKTGKAAVNSATAIKTFNMLKNLYADGGIGNTESFATALELFSKGKAASALVSIEDLNKLTSNPELKNKLGIMNLPAFEEGGNVSVTTGGTNLCILNSSSNKSLALEFSKYEAENRDNIKSLLEKGMMFPAYNNFYTENWFLKTDAALGNIKLWKLLSDEADDIYTINYTDKFNSVSSAIIPVQQSIILKGADSKSSLDDLQKRLETLK
ncbi:ABC transporter substrate-binding protein [Candidatus Clostridium stratigraminis]|uniref:ABC transporter substrate-binding protein n=1 Tax=Candidatus Clostridium stratigraminis TaxID=3381661 RepID=A0ABW8T0E1_9CLOT